MKIDALLSSFFTPGQLNSKQTVKPRPSDQQKPQMSFTYRPTISANNMLLDRRDIPLRLFRADIDPQSGDSPGTVGFTASTTSLTPPTTAAALHNLVLNHIHQEFGEDTTYPSPFISVWSDRRIVEDEIVYFRTRETGYALGLERAGGPGDGWTEEGRGKHWRVWAVTGNRLKHVFRVRDILDWNGGDEAGEEQYVVWKHIPKEAVYAAEGGHYDCIRSKRVKEIKDDDDLEVWMKELKAQADAGAEKEGRSSEAESTDDDVEGEVSIIEEEDVVKDRHQNTEVFMVARGRSQSVGSSGIPKSSHDRCDESFRHIRSKSVGHRASQLQTRGESELQDTPRKGLERGDAKGLDAEH